jgi:hypothetical protein
MEEETRSYEFDEGQNELIGALANRMSWVANFMILLAAIAIVGGFATLRDEGAGSIGQGIIVLILAVWTRKAAQSFHGIVRTEGSDVTNLMAALGELKKLYTLQYWLIIVAIAIVVLFLVLMLIGSVTAVS